MNEVVTAAIHAPRVVAPRKLTPSDYLLGIHAGDRAVLARAISLIESTRPADEAVAEELLIAIRGEGAGSTRVGITGVPGVGKSTFIDRCGTLLCEQGRRVAVLAIDPSSAISGGSILGDRTRMSRLAAHDNAFIRPSPTSGTPGGVARRTRDAIRLCEAAGYDVVLIETVGTGQTETAVANMCDCFLLLTLPGAGDDLQAMKRGVLELVDVVAVNKADSGQERRAEIASQALSLAMQFTQRDGQRVAITTCSAASGVGVDEVWRLVEARMARLRSDGRIQQRRREQDRAWFETLLAEHVTEFIERLPGLRGALQAARRAVEQGEQAPALAVQSVMRSLEKAVN